ncbi:MAG TPA: FecR domain-containing protein [Chitinophaga sp.]
MDTQRFTTLLDKYTRHQCTPEELDELFHAIREGGHEATLGDHIMVRMQDRHISGPGLGPHPSASILHHILATYPKRNILRKAVTRKAMACAAAILLLVVLGVGTWWIAGRKNMPDETSLAQAFMEHRISNTTYKAMIVQLPDGSLVTLQPAAILAFQRQFNTDKREVFLEGEAFFDVAPCAGKPFTVYHGNLMTRVLGTRFYIRENKLLHEVEVEVSAGKVEVSEQADKNADRKRNDGVIITPNQKAVYATDKRLFSTVLVDAPLPITPALPPAAAYRFEAAPLGRVIRQLEADYGIVIQVENADLLHCLFTGNIADQELFPKLDIICQAIGGSYELKGTAILLKGKGCPQ